MSGRRGSWQGVGTHAAALTQDWAAPGFTSGELGPALPLQLLLGMHLAEKDKAKPSQIPPDSAHPCPEQQAQGSQPFAQGVLGGLLGAAAAAWLGQVSSWWMQKGALPADPPLPSASLQQRNRAGGHCSPDQGHSS